MLSIMPNTKIAVATLDAVLEEKNDLSCREGALSACLKLRSRMRNFDQKFKDTCSFQSKVAAVLAAVQSLDPLSRHASSRLSCFSSILSPRSCWVSPRPS